MPSPYYSPGVYVEEKPAGSMPIQGVGTAVAAFIGLAEKGPFDRPIQVTNWGQYTARFGGFVPGTYLAPSVYSYFLNGGGRAYVVRVGDDGTQQNGAAEDGQADPDATTPQAELGGYRVFALGDAGVAGDLSVVVAKVGGDGGDGGDEPNPGVRKLQVRQGDEVREEFEGTTGRGRQNVVTRTNAESKLVRLDDAGTGGDLPEVGTVVTLTVPPPPTAVPSPRLGAEDYIGDVVERTGVRGLEEREDITMLCVPDLMSAYQQGAIQEDTVQGVQKAMIAHCELMGDRMAILDPPPGHGAQEIKEWLANQGYDSKYATLYWPWITVMNPATGASESIPPCGAVAGIWARNDDTRGVHKAPANELVRDALRLEVNITRAEHDALNPDGINCLRSFPGRGTRVWGARTLSKTDKSWQYLNVRRLFNYLEKSILEGTQWVVFEPNDRALWARIRRTISAFLVNEWRKGALFGSTPAEAFYVICDDSTNPAEGINAGEVVCEIGLAPVKPAEFVVFRLSQFSGGTSLVAE